MVFVYIYIYVTFPVSLSYAVGLRVQNIIETLKTLLSSDNFF